MSILREKMVNNTRVRTVILTGVVCLFVGIIFTCIFLMPRKEEVLLTKDKYFDTGYVKNIEEYDTRDYYYNIYNADGNCVKSKKGVQFEPRIRYIDEMTIEIFLSAGSDTFYCTYYDISKDIFSEQYEGRMTVEYGKIAYLEYINGVLSLTVKNIFEGDCDKKRYTLDFAPMVQPITNAEFIGENILYISYYSGMNHLEKEQIIDLSLHNN